MSIEILLVDTCQDIRNRQATELSTEDDIHIIAEADNGQDALHKIQLFPPDLVVMELALPDMCGVQVTRKIMAAHPDTKILLLTTGIDENCFMRAWQPVPGPIWPKTVQPKHWQQPFV